MRPLTPFGLRVRHELMRRGMTIAEMSQELGFNEKAVALALRGVFPGYKYKNKIEQYLDLEPDGQEAAVNE